MKLLLLIGILFTIAAVATAVVVALYFHKRTSGRNLKLMGEIGTVDTPLGPTGTILVTGELWRAKSKSGNTIPARNVVRVVGFEEHLALVEPAK